MCQPGKVLHLYVEVRSVAEEEGKVPERGDDGTNHLMLQCPDILPQSQRSSARSSPSPSFSPDLSPDAHYHNGGANHTLPSSKSSSRHSVSFQLQNRDVTGSSTQVHGQDVLYDTFDQLLHGLAPGRTSPGHHKSPGPVWLNVPSTPTSNRRSIDVPRIDEEGKSSVVTFGYIEKANVHSLGGRRASVCHSESDRMESQLLPAHLRKRLSDPVGYNSKPEVDTYPCHSYSSRRESPQGSPHMQRATRDAVARQATYKALEEFGSPELMRRFASSGAENCSPSLPRHYQPSYCRSLRGSPVLPHSTLTLPSKAQLLELDRGVCRSSVNGLPRSPASDHLCGHARYSSHSGAHASTCHSHGFSESQQRLSVGDESPRLPNKFYPPLPAGKPTDIQHDFPSSIIPTNSQTRTGCQTNGNSQHSVNSNHKANTTSTSRNATDRIKYNDTSDTCSRTHYKTSRCSSRASDAVSPTSGRRSISPSSNREVACKLAVEATKLCSIYADRRTPSPTPSQSESQRSESPKVGGSFRRESQLYATLDERISPESLQADNQNHRWKTDKPAPQTHPGRVSPLLSKKSLSSPASPALPARLHRAAASQSPVLDPARQWSSSSSKDTLTMHRYQQPQYTGDCKSRGTEQRHYDRSPVVSPEVSRRLLFGQNTDIGRDEFFEDRHSPSKVYTPSKEEHFGKNREDKLGNRSVQGYQRPMVVLTMDQREEVQDHSRGAGTSSQSSSGVTGSMGDSSPLDRYNSLSPETSSQSSHDTAETGSGIQVG